MNGKIDTGFSSVETILLMGYTTIAWLVPFDLLSRLGGLVGVELRP